MKIQRDLVVVGHGRGGTSFAAAWLQHNGIFVGHETVQRDGIVESGFSVPNFPIRQGCFIGAAREEFEFKHKLCVVRNPWKVIATYYTVEHPDAIWTHEPHIDLSEAEGDPLAAIAISVVEWTRLGIRYAGHGNVLRVEGFNEVAPAWLLSHGFEDRVWTEVPPNTVNHKPGKRLTREQIIQSIPAPIAREVEDFAKDLGYE